MSTLKINSLQIGQSLTAANNFTWYQPTTPDGTARLGNGNAGSVTDLLTINSSGNVGIGTSSPNSKLHVSSTDNHPVYIQSNQATAYAYFQDSGSGSYLVGIGSSSNALKLVSNGFVQATLDSSGNLGLGVTPSGWKSTLKAFETNNGVALTGYSAVPIMQLWCNAYDNGSNSIYKTSAAATRYEQNAGAHLWYNAPSGTAGNAISFTQAMTLDASGNLLVGDTTASGKLTVKRSTDGTIGYFDGSTTQFRIDVASSTINLNAQNGNAVMAFLTNSTERARIDSSGNFGIGTTSPVNKLDVYGGMGVKLTALTYQPYVNLGTPGGFPGIAIFTNQSSQKQWDYCLNADNAVWRREGSEFMRLDSSGKLGIGTTSPVARLHSYTSDASAATLLQTNNMNYIMLGKIVNGYNNATATPLISFGTGGNTGVMVKIVIRGCSAVNNIMYEDVGYAWWRWAAGSGYVGSGVSTISVVSNIAGTHNVGTLSWANPSTTPVLNYTQANNGYILESIDVYVTSRDGVWITMYPAQASFG